MLNVLNLGAGVQSSCVLLRSCLGELPRFDHVIFADTGWEPEAVYRHLDWLDGMAARHGMAIARVSAGNIRTDQERAYVRKENYAAVEGGRWANLPLFTRNPDGSVGQLKRQCTSAYKIRPIDRKLKSLLGLDRKSHWPKEHKVRQWFGISSDEPERMAYPEVRRSEVVGKTLYGDPIREMVAKPQRWKSHVYPLCRLELFSDRHRERMELASFTRDDCLAWIVGHGFPRPPRSACIGCPYRSAVEWQALTPEEFADAVEFDRMIRHRGGMRGELFLHRSCVPLDQVKFDADDGEGVSRLECMGMCGL